MPWIETEAYRKYRDSEKGRLTRKRYHSSTAYALISEKYNRSPEGKAVRKKARDLWYKTEKGRKYSMWQAAKWRAIRRGLEFSISVNDIKFPEICPLLGLKIDLVSFGRLNNSPSLDRKDSSKGYTKENVWVISTRANILKNNSTVDELSLLVDNLRKCLCGST